MIKKQSVGIWFNIIVAVLTIVSVIVYSVNISGEGYFQNASVANLVAYCVIAVVMLAAVIALAQPKVTGTAAIVTEIISGLLRIAVPVLLTLCLVPPDGDVLQEVQTPANMSSATGTIANMICLGAAAVFAMIAAFFTLRKKEA